MATSVKHFHTHSDSPDRKSNPHTHTHSHALSVHRRTFNGQPHNHQHAFPEQEPLTRAETKALWNERQADRKAR